MKKKSIAIVLSTLLVAGLVLTGCDENGLPTEDEINEITKGLEEFSATMEGVTTNVEAMTSGMDEYLEMAEDIEDEVESVLDGDVVGSIESIGDVSEVAGEVVSEAETVVDAVDAVSPDVEKLVDDVVSGYDNINVIAEDITNIYTKEEVQKLISELESML